MIKGIRITTRCDVKVREYEEEYYKTVGADVGGYIEIVRPRELPEPYVMVVNEEGLLLELPNNIVGSVLYGGYIAGDIVILKEGVVDGEIDFIDMTDEDIDKMEKLLGMKVER